MRILVRCADFGGVRGYLREMGCYEDGKHELRSPGGATVTIAFDSENEDWVSVVCLTHAGVTWPEARKRRR